MEMKRFTQANIGVSLAIIIIFLNACANVVAPTGGPKDETPPVVVEAEPLPYTTEFDTDKIVMEFNEFIELDDIRSKLLVSPPMEKDPEITVKGKKLQIEIISELSDSTTYNIFMADAVTDYTEGNPIENFQYVFSTGSSIDSLDVDGFVYDAFSLIPLEGIYVLLYSDLSDSVIFKKTPEYLSKTNEEGYFRISNIRLDTFKIVGFRDENKNYIYEPGMETIAFSDTLVTFYIDDMTHTDTVYKDDVDLTEIDTASIDEYIDTVIIHEYRDYVIPQYVLFGFDEPLTDQYLTEYKRDDPRKVTLEFSRPPLDTIEIMNIESGNDKIFLREDSEERKNITLWIKDTSFYMKEDLFFELEYSVYDSLNQVMRQIDTVQLSYFFTDDQTSSDTFIDTLDVHLNVANNSFFEFGKSMVFNTSFPLEKVNTELIQMETKVDTIWNAIDFAYKKRNGYGGEIRFQPKENSFYRLTILPGAIKDIYQQVNDTSQVTFKTREYSYYGKIIVDVSGIEEYSVILQILENTKDEKVVQEKMVNIDGKVEFNYLSPKEYLVKAIIDKNQNGKWDSGDYLQHIQPELVQYYEKEVNVRANWDIEINWKL